MTGRMGSELQEWLIPSIFNRPPSSFGQGLRVSGFRFFVEGGLVPLAWQWCWSLSLLAKEL
jgi:hypothetical protein